MVRSRLHSVATHAPMADAEALQRAFCCRLGCFWHISLLFDYLPDTYFYAKDLDGRFVMVNQALAKLVGAATAEEMIGRTDHDYSARDLADQFVTEDQLVIEWARPLPNQAWLIPDRRGVLRWYLSSKIPLFDSHGKVIGIAGAMRDVAKAGVLFEPYREMEGVLKWVFSHYAEAIDVGQLARRAKLSVSQLDRRFKRLFQTTPQQFVLRVRINAACRLLAESDQTVAKIALATGFYDQSHFTKHFRRQMGLTPRAYRDRYARVGVIGDRIPLPSRSRGGAR
ncbi:MAG: helix-turn-helix domain-containing protein [Planctomycetota bacterium]